MRVRIVAVSGAFLMVWVTVAGAAQSLPEIARRARENRSEVENVPVFTNENVRQARSVLASASVSGLPDRPVVTSGRTEETARGRTEAEWREAFADARAEIKRSEDRLELAEQQLVILNRRLLTETSLYNRDGILKPQILDKRRDIEEAKERIEVANRDLADLSRSLRQAGGPAGWSR